MLAEEAKKAASNAGVSLRTLERARVKLKAASIREGFGPGAHYYWELPKDSSLIDAIRRLDEAEIANRPPLTAGGETQASDVVNEPRQDVSQPDGEGANNAFPIGLPAPPRMPVLGESLSQAG